MSSRTPPIARRIEGPVELAGRRIDDPYRWMEDDTPERLAWARAQHEVATARLSALPCRDDLGRRLEELMRPPGVGAFAQAGERSFFVRRPVGRELGALSCQDAPDAAPRLLLDPEELSPDRSIRLADIHPSRDGSLVAYRLARSGSSLMSLHVLDADTGRALPDTIPAEVNPVAHVWHTRNRVAWEPDGGGFYYTRCRLGAPAEESRYRHNVYHHRIGADWRDDLLVFGEALARGRVPYAQLSEDGRHLLILVQEVGADRIRSRLHLLDRHAPGAGFLPLMDGLETSLDVAMHRGRLYLKDHGRAPMGRIMAIRLADVGRDDLAPETVIPEGAYPLGAWALAGDHLVVETIEDVASRLRIHDLSGRFVREIELPGVGSVKLLDSPREGGPFHFAFSSFLTPRTVYRLDGQSLETAARLRAELPHDPAAFRVEQVRFESRDGTPIPMFLLSRRDMARTGESAAVLQVYGGFGVAQAPSFAAQIIPFLESGGLYAVVCTRGGGEFGEAWHRAGSRENKQNVFDDLIGAGEWLIARGYAHPAKLGCFGWSNGGLAVHAAAVQRPELWRAAVAGAPVTDMARFPAAGRGRNWIAEYGSPEDPDDLDALMRYSPYHTLPPRIEAPAILTIVPDEDDRVAPWHGYKMHAAWLAANVSDNPILLRGEAGGGHRGHLAIGRAIERHADIWAFFFEQLGVRFTASRSTATRPAGGTSRGSPSRSRCRGIGSGDSPGNGSGD